MIKKFDEVFVDKTRLGKKIPKEEYKKKGKYIIIDQGKDKIAGFTDNEDGIFTDVPTIIFGDHTRIIKYIDKPFFLGADGVKVLKSKINNANYKYLYYALKAAYIPNTGYNRHFKWLKKVSINYPSFEKQKRIVKLLDNLSEVKNKKNEELKLCDTLIKARFVEMFGSIQDNSKYSYKKISDLTQVLSGGTPKRDVKKYWNNGKIPWIKTTELKNNRITKSEESITELGLQNSSAKQVPAHTILIAMYGQGKTRGMTGYLEIEATTNQACACILPTSKINSEYLWQFLIMSYEILRNMAKGGNQPNLNSNLIKNFQILVPPKSEQNEFTSFVQQVDKSKVAIQKSLDETQILFDSLMQKYFS